MHAEGLVSSASIRLATQATCFRIGNAAGTLAVAIARCPGLPVKTMTQLSVCVSRSEQMGSEMRKAFFSDRSVPQAAPARLETRHWLSCSTF